MKTFNADLWLYLKNELKVLNGKIYFGLAPQETPATYCVIHVLDSGNDVNSQTLCDRDSIGISDLQFNLYATNDMLIDELLQDLNNILNHLSNLTEYRVVSAVRGSTRTARDFSNEVGIGITRYSFKYEKL